MWDANGKVQFRDWFQDFKGMIVDMGFTEETSMRLIMTRLKEGPNSYWRDCESSLLRTGGNPYSYEVFERQMMVAYGSTDLSEQSKLTGR